MPATTRAQINRHIEARLRQARLARRMTPSELAEQIGHLLALEWLETNHETPGPPDNSTEGGKDEQRQHR